MIRSPISLELQTSPAPASRLADDSPVPAEVIGARQSALKGGAHNPSSKVKWICEIRF
jgi:hypothetical protein